ncbi:MAG TPA: tetraacyldisaccharide 4'-kinase [Geomonas sp.]|nr:tetraacyldisaccharide 4'-kinase [Geomonas sp.]HJV35503.1 tetraacyldisaccharide 4'-kinase [Geomonas sp.]
MVSGKRERLRDRLLWVILRLAAVLYAQVLRARASAYRLGLLPSYRLPVPVISVGNITLGGTGKTPMVAWLAEYFIRRGKRVAVISRGYRGSAEGSVLIVSDGTTIRVSPEESGDEPYLLAKKLPGLMVVIGADRRAAAQTAMRELQPDLFILDDAFQHLRVKRDLNILLLDATRPFSNGATLPAGFLREAPSAAGRADLVVYTRTREGEATPDAVPGKPYCRTKHKLAALLPLGGGEAKPLNSIPSTARVLAFSGIADPSSFFDGLEAEGVGLITTLAFSDHTPYGEEEIAAILRLREASRSTVMLTTEKDAVKLLGVADRLVNCYAVSLELQFFDAAPMETALEKLMAGEKRGGAA